jgi:replication factor C small subunit
MSNLFDKPPQKPKKDHFIWEERHRPATLDDYIGNEDFKEKLEEILKTNQLSHMMLHGDSPGTGKTSAAKLIANSINCDYIYINASDENNIDTVRTKINSFASTTGFSEIKIVILDEADAMTAAAQKALKNTIETYSEHTRFIFTCNNIEKIISPIISRCQVYEILPPSKKDVAFKLKSILDLEKVKYTTDDLGYIVNTFYPDMRKMIGYAQQYCKNGELKLKKDSSVNGNIATKLIDFLQQYNKPSTFNDIRQLVADNDIKHFDDFYQCLYDRLDGYTDEGKKTLIILTIAEYMYQSSMVVNKEITFMACISKILTELKK